MMSFPPLPTVKSVVDTLGIPLTEGEDEREMLDQRCGFAGELEQDEQRRKDQLEISGKIEAAIREAQ